MVSGMGLPTEPVTLSVEQIADLQNKLSELRHDINNHLSLIVAAAELIKFNPELSERMCTTLSEQPPKISNEMGEYAQSVDEILGITRD